MRRKESEIRETGELRDIIQRAQICRIGLSENDTPYIIPMNFGYRDERLFFHCALQGRKLDIIRDNPKVCFEMDVDYEISRPEGRPCGWSAKYRSIIGTGTADIIEDPHEKSEALNIIIGHYGGKPYDFSETELEKVCIIKITIDNLSGKQAGY